MQSKLYTLNSIKSEIRNQVLSEKRMILEYFNGLIFSSRYTSIFKSFMGQGVINDMVYVPMDYIIDLNCMEEDIAKAIIEVQLFIYIPKSIKDIAFKISDFFEQNYKHYDILAKSPIKKEDISDSIHSICNNVHSWLSEMIEIRNNALIEADEWWNKINNCKSTIKIDSIKKELQKESYKSGQAIKKFSNKLKKE